MNSSKRNFIKGLGVLTSAGLLTSFVNGQQVGAQNSSVFNVKDFGAKGDGITSDSDAIQKALDAAGKVHGTAYFPSGNYMCHDLKVHSYSSVMAEHQWGYREKAGAVLTIDNEDADCIFNISETFGCHIRGLYLQGNRSAKKIQHGIFLNHPVTHTKGENSPVIEDMCITNFSGHGVYLLRIWLFIIRHSIIKANEGHGVCINGWDGFVIDNQFAGNGKSGFACETEGCAVMFTANRVEWNREYGLYLFNGDCWNVTGNAFDRNFGAAISANTINDATFTGNVFRRNGKDSEKLQEGLDESCQILVQNCRGISITGNSGAAGQDDFGRGTFSPNYVFWLKDNTCSVITANAFYNGYLKDMIIDKGGNTESFLINNNIGSSPVQI